MDQNHPNKSVPTNKCDAIVTTLFGEILDLQEQALVQGVIKAFDLPPPYPGLVAGIREAARCLEALCVKEDFAKLHEFSNALSGVRSKLSGAKQLSSHLFVPNSSASGDIFQLFTEKKSRHLAEIDSDIQALKGLALTNAVAGKTRISPTFAARLLTLQRSAQRNGAHAQKWRDFAAKIPFSIVDAEALIQKSSFEPISEFIRDLIALLNGSVPTISPNAIEHKPVNPSFLETPSDQARSDTFGTTDEPDLENYASVHGFVAWQQKRSTNTTRLENCGFPHGWNHLHPEELREVTTRLKAVLSDQSADQKPFACLALISLATGLPPSLALNIPLAPNDDLWLEATSGIIHWNLNKIVKRGPPEPAVLANSYHPSEIIRLPMPAVIKAHLRDCLSLHADACRVRALLFPQASNQKNLLSSYEYFLKQGQSSSHAPETSRFAYSLGRCLLAQSGQDVLAAIGSMNFELAAPGQLHYFCVQETLLFDVLDQTYTFLGLGCISRPDESGHIGSPYRPRDETIEEGWHLQAEKTRAMIASISPRQDIRSFSEIFNQLALFNLAATVFLTGHRGSRIERMTYPMLFASNEFICINDKQSREYSSFRILPRCIVANRLDQHLALIHQLARRFEKHDRKFSRRLLSIASGDKKHSPMFFSVHETDGCWKISPFKPDDLTRFFLHNFGTTRNFGRHHWLSKLIETSADRMLARFFLGHARRGIEPHGMSSGSSVRAASHALSQPIRAIATQYRLLEPGAPRRDRSTAITFIPSKKLRIIDNKIVAEAVASFDVAGHLPALQDEQCPFDNWTVACHAVTQDLRQHFIAQTTELSPWSRFLAALIIFDAAFDERLLRSAWVATREKPMRIGVTSILRCALPTSIRPILLQPPTTVCLNHALNSHPMPAFESSRRELGRWASKVLQTSKQSPQDEFGIFLAVVSRWASLELPPWLNTTSNVDFSAAAISMESIARLVFNRPAIDAPLPETLAKYSRIHTSLSAELDNLGKIINEVADNKKKLGENQERMKKIRENLQGLATSTALSPLAEDVLTWLRHETTLPKPLEASSISSYFSKLRAGLESLDSESSFYSIEPDEWIEFKNVIEQGQTGEQLQQRKSIIRRFAAFWASAGSPVPRAIFSGGESGAATIRHASSIFVSGSDIAQIAKIVQSRFESEHFLALKAHTKLMLCACSPFRSAEVNCLRSVDIPRVTPAVFITSSGFSHLKGQERSRGVVALPIDVHQELLSLCGQVSHLSFQQKGYVWLVDGPTCHFVDADKVDRTLRKALQISTGERNARVHSLRGSAVARIIAPDLEQLFRRMAGGGIPCLTESPMETREWLKVSTAARQARHSQQITTMKYYCGIWPLQLFLELGLALSIIPVEHGYGKLVEGLSDQGFRQHRSRSRRRSPTNEMAIWEALLKRLPHISSMPSIETLLIPAGGFGLPNLDQVSTDTDRTAVQHIHYAMLRLCGLTIELATLESRISSHSLPWIETAIRNHSADNTAILDDHTGNNSTKQQRCWQRDLASPDGQALIHAASRLQNSKTLSDAILLLEPEGRLDVDEERMLKTARDLREILPAEVTFCLLPALCTSTPYLLTKISLIDPTAKVKRSSRRMERGYRMTLTSRHPNKRGPNPDGRTTRIFLQALRARQIFCLNNPPPGENKDV